MHGSTSAGLKLKQNDTERRTTNTWNSSLHYRSYIPWEAGKWQKGLIYSAKWQKGCRVR